MNSLRRSPTALVAQDGLQIATVIPFMKVYIHKMFYIIFHILHCFHVQIGHCVVHTSINDLSSEEVGWTEPNSE